jgi:multidrug resistance efflux pump
VPVKIELDQSGPSIDRLRPGMSVEAHIDTAETRSASRDEAVAAQ